MNLAKPIYKICFCLKMADFKNALRRISNFLSKVRVCVDLYIQFVLKMEVIYMNHELDTLMYFSLQFRRLIISFDIEHDLCFRFFKLSLSC